LEILLSEIKFDDTTRVRTDLGEESLLELIESFKNVGQITPIVVDRTHRLIAGRRRLEAARRLSWSAIRAEYFEDLDPLTQKIVEFDENSKRLQLTWQEAARAIKEIHELKKATEGNWSASDTARTLGISIGKVSEDLLLASALDNTRVVDRPSRRGALTTVKRERELILVRELARRRAVDLGVTSDHLVATTGGVIYNASCLDILREMSENSVDLVVTDPPWGINFDKASQWTTHWIGSYDDREETVRATLTCAFPLLYRVLKPTCHLYTFFPIQEAQWWVSLMTEAGFIVRQRPLIWFKTGQIGITDTYSSFLPVYESILWAFKPGANDIRRLFSRAVPEAQGWPREPTIWHENSKPTEMLGKWIESSSEGNEIVLDPFSGGGSTLAAAFGLGRYYIGCEQDAVHYTKSLERLRSLEERKDEEVEED